MRFPAPLVPAVLVRRYKRFLADVRLPDGSILTAHCPNPGAMTGCAEPGFPARLSRSPNPGRKLPCTLELVHNGACWVGVNPALANAVVAEALAEGRIPSLAGYGEARREAPLGRNSRCDFLLAGPRGRLYLEVKSATLLGRDGLYAFPDAVTARGLKHMRELAEAARAGHRAAVLFLIQRSDGAPGFRAAREIDPAYARGLAEAAGAGVEVLPYLTTVDEEGITLEGLVPFLEDGAHPGPGDPRESRPD